MKKSALSNEAARQAQERTSPWKRPRLWRELAVIFLGSLLFAASMNCIVLPTGMYSGGFWAWPSCCGWGWNPWCRACRAWETWPAPFIFC
ncbi:MAG: hypothetical protein ACLSCQ_01370 [Evtepia gabavorous]